MSRYGRVLTPKGRKSNILPWARQMESVLFGPGFEHATLSALFRFKTYYRMAMAAMLGQRRR